MYNAQKNQFPLKSFLSTTMVAPLAYLPCWGEQSAQAVTLVGGPG